MSDATSTLRVGVAGVGRIGALHAANLAALPGVDVLVTDPDTARAEALAAEIGATAVDADGWLAADAVVIASSTDTHAGLLRRAMAAGRPVFCEKPVATTLDETVELARLEAETGAYVHVGFQRRFDSGYRRVHDAVAGGELGRLHSVRATTLDNAPPPAAYVASSGGIFADCCIHDFDVIRFVTGREVVTAYATGGNTGPAYIAELGDSDTVAGVLTLDDGTLVSFAGGRINGYGHDVRMEVHGTSGVLAVGWADFAPVRSAEEGVTFPNGEPVQGFIDRFLPAYGVELGAFVDTVRAGAGGAVSPCRVRDGLEAMRIATACTRSRDSGMPVELSSIAGM